MHDVVSTQDATLRLLITANTQWAMQAAGFFLQSVMPGCSVQFAADVDKLDRLIADESGDLLVVAAMNRDPEHEVLLDGAARRWPEMPKILLSPCPRGDLAQKARAVGVGGYVTTDLEPAAVQLVLGTVMAGEVSFPQIENGAANDVEAPHNLPANLEERLPKLTRRERQVMQLLGQGYANKEIAEMLDLREGTVRIYVHRVIRQLGLRNRVDVALCANYVGAAR